MQFPRSRGAINGSADRSWIATRDMALRSVVSDAGQRPSAAAALTWMPTPPLHRDAPAEQRSRGALDYFGRGEKATCALMIQDK